MEYIASFGNSAQLYPVTMVTVVTMVTGPNNVISMQAPVIMVLSKLKSIVYSETVDEVCEWISNFTRHFRVGVINYACCDDN